MVERDAQLRDLLGGVRLAGVARQHVAFAISPTFDRDNLAFYALDGVLYRSTDMGITWGQALAIPSDQLSGACPHGWGECNPGCPEYLGRGLLAPNCPQLIVSPNVMSDGLFNIDFSLYKNFALLEKFKVQLKGEAYNLTNTPTFDVPNRDINAQNFGTVTSTALNPRPRSVQLSVRLTF